MIIKHRYESSDLKLFRCLHLRTNLSENDGNYYDNLEKGFEGELKFDKYCEALSDEYFILNDLLFESNNTTFQIDSLLISQNTIFLIEVKNFEGDYYIDGDEWYSINKKVVKNPISQLKRCESLFRRLLQDLGFSFSIESYLVFVNPNFILYQAPLNLPIIFPAQINRFIDKLNAKPCNLTKKHTKLAELLLAKHLSESPYTKVPDYSYGGIENGVICGGCGSLMLNFNLTSLKCKCEKCSFIEDIKSVVLRTVKEYEFLFPDKKITTNSIQEWCGGIISRKTIWKILRRNYKLLGYGKSAYYVETSGEELDEY